MTAVSELLLLGETVVILVFGGGMGFVTGFTGFIAFFIFIAIFERLTGKTPGRAGKLLLALTIGVVWGRGLIAPVISGFWPALNATAETQIRWSTFLLAYIGALIFWTLLFLWVNSKWAELDKP